jgi:hypothetical protein
MCKMFYLQNANIFGILFTFFCFLKIMNISDIYHEQKKRYLF